MSLQNLQREYQTVCACVHQRAERQGHCKSVASQLLDMPQKQEEKHLSHILSVLGKSKEDGEMSASLLSARRHKLFILYSHALKRG